MPIILNKKKDFQKNKEIPSATLKAQDETIQITKKEWDAMQESLSQLQTFMNDLVEGNLEIEIIDDNSKEEEPKEEVEEIEIKPKEGKLKEESDEETEEEIETPAEETEEDDKAEDAELEETLKDPAKRKAVLEYLKATDATYPIKDMTMSQIRKRISTIVSREKFDVAKKGSVKMTPSEVINEIMVKIKKEKQKGKPISVENIGRVTNKVLNSLDLEIKSEDKKPVTMKRKTIKKSQDTAIPDFTSRFEDKPRVKKAVDNKSKKDLSQEFMDRFK